MTLYISMKVYLFHIQFEAKLVQVYTGGSFSFDIHVNVYIGVNFVPLSIWHNLKT